MGVLSVTVKKDVAGNDATKPEKQRQKPVTQTLPKDLSLAMNTETRHEVKDPINLKHCRFFNQYVLSCHDADCPYSDTCEAFNKGDD